jgi:Trk K+ transport system NAD-binding subunit
VATVEAAGVRVMLVDRNGTASVPDASLLLQHDDLVHVLVDSARLGDVDAALHAGHTH